MAGYLNADGLYWKWGPTEATEGQGGEYNVGGNVHWTEVEIDLVSLGTASAVLSDTVTIPIGARIEEVEIIAETLATSGGAAALNVGLYRTDRTTAIDADGLVAAAALATINAAGEKQTLIPGSTGAGALIGTTLTNPGLLVADYDTAAYTAGRLIVRVYWYKP